MPDGQRRFFDRLTRREVLQAGTLSTLVGLGAGRPVASQAGAAADGSSLWSKIAAEFLIEPGLACLNTGSLGTSPPAVLAAAEDAWRRLESNPVALGYGAVLTEADNVRKKAAELLGCQTEELAITRNTTDGMNLIAQGIDLRAGDHVLTTDHEHGGGLRCWEHYVKRKVIVLDHLTLPVPPKTPEEIVPLFEAAITPKTRVISVSHVTYSTGLQLPIRQIAEVAKKHNCLLVIDGAQAAGAIPIDVKALGCHAYATSGHKWLLGSKGTGLLYIDHDARSQIAPMLFDEGPGVYTAVTGVPNIPGIIGLGAAIDWAAQIGRSRIEERILSLRNQLYKSLGTVPGLKLLSPPPGSKMASPMLGLALPIPEKAGAIAEALANKYKIVVKTVHGHGVDFRISMHVCNTEEHIERLVVALKKLLT